MSKSVCRVCGRSELSLMLDLGEQPVSNRFLQHVTVKEKLYPLRLGFCESCATIQLNNPVSYTQVIPPYSWIKYNEPEAHLDSLVEVIKGLQGISSDSKVLGLSYKDDSTLARLNKFGFSDSYRLHLRDDLGVRRTNRAGVESIQHRLTPDMARSIVSSRGRCNILIARHILEHAHKPARFMQALIELVDDNGYLVIEVPDEQRAFDLRDVMVAWEEHVVYFTPKTFSVFWGHFNCRTVKQLSYKYPLENSLIMILQKKRGGYSHSLTDEDRKAERRRFEQLSEAVPVNKAYYHKLFEKYRKQKKKVALLGASHLAIKFINIYDLHHYIEFIVDDDMDKQRCLMPGSKLAILPSSALIEKKIDICLTGVNPLIEKKVIKSNGDFLRNGGRFYSIFNCSRLAL